MADREFADLVTRLRDEYLDAGAGDHRDEWQLAMRRHALPIGAVQFLLFFLHPDGELLAYNWAFDETTTFTHETSVTWGIRLGCERHPELRELLPPKPDGGTDCVACGGRGETGTGDERDVCSVCAGRGWLGAGVQELIDRTAHALRAAGDDRDETARAAARFVADGLALGPAWPLLSYFSSALLVADLGEGADEWRISTLGRAADERLNGQWPHPSDGKPHSEEGNDDEDERYVFRS